MWEEIIGIIGFIIITSIIYKVIKVVFRQSMQRNAEIALRNLTSKNGTKTENVPSIKDLIELENYLINVKNNLSNKKVIDKNEKDDSMYQ